VSKKLVDKEDAFLQWEDILTTFILELVHNMNNEGSKKIDKIMTG